MLIAGFRSVKKKKISSLQFIIRQLISNSEAQIVDYIKVKLNSPKTTLDRIVKFTFNHS